MFITKIHEYCLSTWWNRISTQDSFCVSGFHGFRVWAGYARIGLASTSAHNSQ